MLESREPATPHRRLNPLTGEWVLVSPHRMQRPWQGQVDAPVTASRPHYDAGCYLCPGNVRAKGERNPDYGSCFTFTNDFPALLPERATEPTDAADRALLQRAEVSGTCRVVCFSPRHDLTLAEMTVSGISEVIDVWIEQTVELGRDHTWVQVFENKGELMGCSNPHPHGQIWALDSLPTLAAREDAQQNAHLARTGRNLLVEYAALEHERRVRTVVENDHWIAVVPYWAEWPFEALLLPRRHVLRMPNLQTGERTALADLLKRLLVRYDNLFATSFPYSMGWHGAPHGTEDSNHWQLHGHVFPPLLRSASVKKFMVGFEMLGEAQRDLTPEQAAERLRATTEVHYRQAATP